MIELEPIDVRHAPDVQLLAGDKAISEMTRVPYPYPPDGAITFIEKIVKGRELGREYVFAIRKDGSFVGVCGFHKSDQANNCFELGYWIGKPFWGKGIATEAVSLAMQFAVTVLKGNLIYANCLARNSASQRVLKKNGFIERARFQNTELTWKPEDIIIRYEYPMSSRKSYI